MFGLHLITDHPLTFIEDIVTDIPQQGQSGRTIYLQTLGAAVFASGYIFAPMIFFGGIGYWLSERFDSKIYLFVGLGVALIASYAFLFIRLPKNVKKMQERIK